MSGGESDNIEKNESKKSKFSMQNLKNIRQLEKEEIFSYIEILHGQLKKNEKKIKKYKKKIKMLVKNVEELEHTQKEPKDRTKASSTEATDRAEEQVVSLVEGEANTALSLVDEIRQAAEQAQNLNGFVYEPTSGLYYDQKTGYYYNAEYGLYYDGNTGCYYKYNQEKNEFEFHSQVSVTESTAAATTETSNDNDIFDNYTIGATADNSEEWGVITERPRLKVKINKDENRKSSAENGKDRKQQRQQRKRSHRQRYSSSETDSSDVDRNRTRDKRKFDSAAKVEAKDMEDGELGSSNSASDSQDNQSSCNMETEPDNDESIEIFNKGSRFQDIAKKYPPSLRIIVLESQQEELKVGSLSLITFKGGTLGREGKHDVIIPDVNVSKFHLKFIYDTKGFTYKCIDLGSRNGTILNGSRMSPSKRESEPLDLFHGSVLQIGQTKLLCHVHEGNSTCGQCEPGLLIESKDSALTSSTNTVALTHKEQLKKLQKRYGLENEKFIESKGTNNNYNDRAATRRFKVGSSTDKEKTQIASVNTAISSENKGFKMLSKLGWSKGEALGKTSAGGGGLLEPINVSSNTGKKGLGCEDSTAGAPMLTQAAKTKLANLKKTQERYQKADIFLDSDDEKSS